MSVAKLSLSPSFEAGRDPKRLSPPLYYALTYFADRSRPHPKMSEKELSRKERLVLSIKARIGQLVYAVQDDEAHMRFKPGCCWWISTIGASARKKYPDGVHFCEQIGVSQEDFEFALGRKWLWRQQSFLLVPSNHARLDGKVL